MDNWQQFCQKRYLHFDLELFLNIKKVIEMFVLYLVHLKKDRTDASIYQQPFMEIQAR